jgi:chromosome segregation ATPase
MNANELADYLDNNVEAMLMSEQKHIDQAATVLRNQQALIENLNGRIERMIEKQSHYESMAHAGGFEAGRQQGMKQERALWELASSTQEIQQQAETGFYKQDADKYKLKCESQQAEIEALQSIVNSNKEVMADWEAEVKSVRENNTLCWRSQRQQQEQIEALQTELHKYKPQIWEVMKEANK